MTCPKTGRSATVCETANHQTCPDLQAEFYRLGRIHKLVDNWLLTVEDNDRMVLNQIVAELEA